LSKKQHLEYKPYVARHLQSIVTGLSPDDLKEVKRLESKASIGKTQLRTENSFDTHSKHFESS